MNILPEGRSPEDEKYLSCIVEANPASKYLYIVDTRPKINALYNRSGTSVLKSYHCRIKITHARKLTTNKTEFRIQNLMYLKLPMFLFFIWRLDLMILMRENP